MKGTSWLGIATFAALLVAFAGFAYAEFAQTTVYFNVPVRLSFTITLPDTVQTNASGTTAPWSADATADINFTLAAGSISGTHVQPCLTVAFGGGCQTGPAVPIFAYKNTGTTNISMWLKFNASLPTGIVVGVNSTASGTGNNMVNHTALYDVNNSLWANAFQDLNISSNQYANVSLYANFTNVQGGINVRLLAHNSTQTTSG
ncbi:MAG: hypothetical protein V1787_02995 [Candidatus Micrarchaeota archaeon]